MRKKWIFKVSSEFFKAVENWNSDVPTKAEYRAYYDESGKITCQGPSIREGENYVIVPRSLYPLDIARHVVYNGKLCKMMTVPTRYATIVRVSSEQVDNSRETYHCLSNNVFWPVNDMMAPSDIVQYVPDTTYIEEIEQLMIGDIADDDDSTKKIRID